MFDEALVGLGFFERVQVGVVASGPYGARIVVNADAKTEYETVIPLTACVAYYLSPAASPT